MQGLETASWHTDLLLGVCSNHLPSGLTGYAHHFLPVLLSLVFWLSFSVHDSSKSEVGIFAFWLYRPYMQSTVSHGLLLLTQTGNRFC